MQDPIYAKIESLPRPTLSAAIGLVFVATAGLWVSVLLDLLFPNLGMAASNALYYLPFIALPIAAYALRHPGLGEAMRLNPLPPLSVLTLALLALLCMYVASLVTGLWGAALDALGLRGAGSVPMPETERELALSIIALAAFPAVCEELLFRGFALAAWETRGTWYAIGATTLLFALLHGNLYGLPAYILVGGVAGFVTWALDSVYAGMTFHTLYNAACLIVPWLLRNEPEGEVAMGGVMVLSLLLEALMMVSMAGLMLASLRLRARRDGVEPIPRIPRPLSARERALLLATLAAMAVTHIVVLVLMTV